MIEQSILKIFVENEHLYDKYKGALRLDDFVKQSYPILFKMFQCLPVASLTELEATYLTKFPVIREGDRQAISTLIKTVGETECSADAIVGYLEMHRARSAANDIGLIALEVADGRKPFEELQEVINNADITIVEEELDNPLTTNLDEMMEEEELDEGLHWRLKCLNQSLGPLRKGNFGQVFARVETGKTAFWVSEVTHMASQLPEDESILIFFNEEQGKDVIWRMYSAVSGMTYMELRNNVDKAKEIWNTHIGTRIKFFNEPTQVAKRSIEKLMEHYKPALTIIDNMDKVKGFTGDREDMRLHEIYKWGRELAATYCPILTVGQASADGHNSKWLDESQMANSKTGKPSELDFIIGIGRTDKDGYEDVRHIFLSKNKLRGDRNTIEGLRHLKTDVILESAISRYKDT